MSSLVSSFSARLAVVGAGGAGRLHARACASFPGVRVCAICDLSLERASALATELGASPYVDLGEMLERERPDIVCVATGERQHEAAVTRALEAGAHVLCEKVMADTLVAGERMIETARQTKRVLAVNYNYRHLPVFKTIKARLAAGTLGKPMLTVVQASTYCWHHMLDLLCFLHGPPARVSAAIRNPPGAALPLWSDFSEMLYLPTDSAIATLEWTDGRSAVLAATKFDNVAEHLADVAIYGTDSRLAVHDLRLDNLGGCHRSGEWSDSPAPADLAVSFEQSFTLSLHAFLQSVRDGMPPPTSGEDGLRVMRLENAILRAATMGDGVRLAA